MAEANSKQALVRAANELWWLWVVQAILAIIFGVLAVFWPGITLVTLVYLIGAFVFGIGVVEIVRSLMNTKRSTWWMSLILGILASGVGIYLARHPHVTFATFITVIGVSFVVWGVIDIIRAFFEPANGSHRVLNFIVGLLALAVGIYTLAQPVSGGLAFVWAYGVYALVSGVVSLVVALRAHSDLNRAKATL